MNKPITYVSAALLLVLSLATTREAGGQSMRAPSDTKKGPPLGTCPNIYYESSKELSNGAVVTWTSSFGGFDYTSGSDYWVTVSWTVSGASHVSYMGFGGKKKTWTPRWDTGGSWLVDAGNAVSGSIDLMVNMSSMHRSVQPNWQGYTGNGHFKLELDVDGVRAKLGVNTHLEDPDLGSQPRCP